MKSSQSINYKIPGEEGKINLWQKYKWEVIFALSEILILVLFSLFTEYN